MPNATQEGLNSSSGHPDVLPSGQQQLGNFLSPEVETRSADNHTLDGWDSDWSIRGEDYTPTSYCAHDEAFGSSANQDTPSMKRKYCFKSCVKNPGQKSGMRKRWQAEIASQMTDHMDQLYFCEMLKCFSTCPSRILHEKISSLFRLS